ncbi:major capsid family protein [Novosphingobium sp.]|uniref:major capsid family protein n=1 Tax=Novosphingobium sp. TaxID=1874826 RepID=UPI00286E0086|nr:major capsid family protein [Novosphingobium sp.]
MSKVNFYDSIEGARIALDAENPSLRFADAIRGVDLNDAQQTLSFLNPQLLRVEQAVYMTKYPAANYAEFMPVDVQGSIWTAGSLFYSGDVAGKAEWFDVAADDMPYADFSRTQFLQENHMAGIGYKWNRGDLERGSQLGIDVLSQKAGAATKVAERFLHTVATLGDGVKFTTGFFNNPLATTAAAGATLAASTPDAAIAIINTALTSVEINTGETYMADTLVLPTAVYNALASRRVTDTNMTMLAYIQANSVVPNLTIKKTRHLTTTMMTYANTMEVHRFHLPGGGHQFFPMWQKGPFSWETPGIMSTGGYENRIPKAITITTGIA